MFRNRYAPPHPFLLHLSSPPASGIPCSPHTDLCYHQQQERAEARQRALCCLQTDLPSRRPRHFSILNSAGKQPDLTLRYINGPINGSEVRRLIVFATLRLFTISSSPTRPPMVSASFLHFICPCFDLTDRATNVIPFCRNFSDQECTRKDNGSGLGEADQWRLSPSMLDTSSFAFASFTNHHTSDFGSTPGCISTVFHNTAGDLHTPGMGFQLGTPLSISTSEAQRNPASAMGTHAFPSHLLQSQPFQNPSPFTPQPTYAPSSFVHQDSGYETIEPPYDCLPADKSNIDMEPREELPSVRSSARSFEIEQGRSVPPTEKFV